VFYCFALTLYRPLAPVYQLRNSFEQVVTNSRAPQRISYILTVYLYAEIPNESNQTGGSQ